MNQEHRKRSGRDDGAYREISRAEAQLADRLDRLSTPMAENVLQRAIDLHQDQVFDDTIAWDQVEKIGAELGIDAATLRQALLAELDTEQSQSSDEPSLWDRLFAPETVTGGIVAEGDADEVQERLDEWMRDLEGMAPTRREGTSTTWEPATTLLAALSRAFAGEQAGDLRRFGPITTRVTEVANGDQLVEFSVDAQKIRQLSFFILGLYAAAGAFFGTMLAGAGPDFLPGILEFFLPFLGVSAVGVVGAWQSAKSGLRKIRQGINRALDGVVHATTFKKRKSKHKHSKKPFWAEIVEEIFDEIFD